MRLLPSDERQERFLLPVGFTTFYNRAVVSPGKSS